MLNFLTKDKRIKSSVLMLLGFVLQAAGVDEYAKIIEAVGAAWNITGWVHAGARKVVKKA